MEKTYLDVPHAHREYAARFGAVSDQSTGRYFVLGEVPSELYSYVPKEPRHRNYVNEVGQQCAVCGAAMEIRERRSDRSLYYRCVSCLSMLPV